MDVPAVCILVGGRATRLGNLSRSTPKALIPVAGQPFIFHQLQMLGSQGVSKVVLCVGHLGDEIREKVGARRFDVDVEYSYDAPGLSGTLGAVRLAQDLVDRRFLVMYGDTYLSVDLGLFFNEWQATGLLGGMTVLKNSGRWGQSNAEYRDGLVVAYDKHQATERMFWIDYGLGALDVDSLGCVADSETDLSALQKILAAHSQLFGFEVQERFYEIGTPSALEETDAYLRAGLQS